MKARKTVANGKPAWVVALGIRQVGKRMRVFGATKEKAESRAAEKMAELREHGHNLSDVSAAHRGLIIQWRDRLTVEQMDEAFRNYTAQNPTEMTVSAAVEEYRKKKEATFSRQHAASLRSRFRRFLAAFPGARLCEVRKGQLEDFIGKQGASGKNYHRQLSAFFAYSCRHEWIAIDPMLKVESPGQGDAEKTILKVGQMKALLGAASGLVEKVKRHDATLALVVLGGLCGLRTSEALRLRWDDIDLAGGEIHLRKLKTHKRGLRERFVQILPAAAQWLALLKKSPDGRVVAVNDKNARENRKRIVKAAKLKVWPHNVLRRSWASYHLAAFENSALTAAQAGHTSADTTYGKYRTLARKGDGEQWFALTPSVCAEQSEKIVAFEAA